MVITTLILLALVLLYINGRQHCQGAQPGSSAHLGPQLQPGLNKPCPSGAAMALPQGEPMWQFITEPNFGVG